MGDWKTGYFVKACIFRNRLEILDTGKARLIGINGPENSIPDFRPAGAGAVISSDHPLAYMDVFLVKDRIYGLYSGKIDRKVLEQGRRETSLLVFKRSGEIESHLVLGIPISSFTVDEEGNRIIGVTADREPCLVVFDLN